MRASIHHAGCIAANAPSRPHGRRFCAVSIRNRTIRNAFTLIELLVVIAIISLLVSILLPSLQQAKLLAQSAVCLSTQRSLGMGLQMYTAEHAQKLPRLLNRNYDERITDNDSVPGGAFATTSWLGVGEDHWQTWMDAIWDFTGSLDAYRCATQGRADDKPGYGYNGWISGEYQYSAGYAQYAPDEPISIDDISSTSELIFTGDSVPSNDQGLILVRPDAIWGPSASWPGHSGGGNFAFADGHAEGVTNDDSQFGLIYLDWGTLAQPVDHVYYISPNYNHNPPDL